MSLGELSVKYGVFLADQHSSIGDLVSQSVSRGRRLSLFDAMFLTMRCLPIFNDALFRRCFDKNIALQCFGRCFEKA